MTNAVAENENPEPVDVDEIHPDDLKCLEITHRVLALRRKGLTTSAIAEEVEANQDRVANFLSFFTSLGIIGRRNSEWRGKKGGNRISDEVKKKFHMLRQAGMSIADASTQCGINISTGYRFNRRMTAEKKVEKTQADGTFTVGW